jgi:hypothetical protein
MSAAVLQHHIHNDRTATQLNAIGPSTNTTLRPNSSLPNTLSTGGSDANTVYIDVTNGLDTNSGFTLALAKKSWESARAACVAAGRHTIHIANTGTSLTHSNLGSINLTADTSVPKSIQVAAGQTATLVVTSNSVLSSRYIPTAPGIPEWNGLFITDNRTSSQNTDTLLGDSNATTWRFCEYASINRAPIRLTNTLLIYTGALPPALLPWFLVDEPIFTRVVAINLGTIRPFCKITSTIGILSLNNTTLLQWDTLIDTDTAITGTKTVTLSDCIISCTRLFNPRNSVIIPTSINALINAKDVSGVSFFGNQPRNLNPLFRNELAKDFRLANIAIILSYRPDGSIITYPRNSPASQIGTAGIDLGAFSFTYTETGETFEQLVFPEDFGYDAVTQTIERTNFSSWQNIEGTYFATWDGINKELSLTLAQNYWVGHDFSNDLVHAAMDRTPKRFYPNGSGGVLAIFGTGTFDTESAALSAGLRSYRIAHSGIMPRLNQFQSWVAAITVPNPILSQTVFAQILRNYFIGTDFIVWVKPIRGATIVPNASGGGAIIITYLPVEFTQASMNQISEYYSEDQTIQLFKPWAKQSTEDNEAEFHTRTVSFKITAEEPV